MSAINSDLAGIDPDSLRPYLCNNPVCTRSTQYRRPALRACRRPRVPAIERLLNPPFPILEHSTSTTWPRVTGNLGLFPCHVLCTIARNIQFQAMASCPRERVAKWSMGTYRGLFPGMQPTTNSYDCRFHGHRAAPFFRHESPPTKLIRLSGGH